MLNSLVGLIFILAVLGIALYEFRRDLNALSLISILIVVGLVAFLWVRQALGIV